MAAKTEGKATTGEHRERQERMMKEAREKVEYEEIVREKILTKKR